MTERTQILIGAVASRFRELSRFKPPWNCLTDRLARES